jgi:hypothetical protein
MLYSPVINGLCPVQLFVIFMEGYMVDLDDYEIRLIGSLLEDIRKPVPRNLCPTFYRTLNYADECKLKEKADNIAEKLGIDEDEI